MDDSTLLRYNRQIMLPAVGIEGQQALSDSRVLVVGLGGLGSPASMYLASSGIGHLVVNDFDEVDLSNLQRQIVHNTSTIGNSKVGSALQTLSALNPEIKVDGIHGRLQDDDLVQQVEAADVVLDATDNFNIRYALNEACVRSSTPLVSAAAIRFEGQVTVYQLDQLDSPCFRCLYAPEDEPEERCSETGVLGPVTGVIGCIQAIEVIKIITNVGNTLTGRLMLFDAALMRWEEIRINKNSTCPVCSSESQ